MVDLFIAFLFIYYPEPWNINEVMVYNLFNAYDFFYGDSTEKKKVIHVTLSLL